MKKLKLSLFVLFSFNAFLFSQNNSVTEKIISEGKSNNKTMFIADVLCNRFGGRVTGSAAYTNAANWVYDELKNYDVEDETDELRAQRIERTVRVLVQVDVLVPEQEVVGREGLAAHGRKTWVWSKGSWL